MSSESPSLPLPASLTPEAITAELTGPDRMRWIQRSRYYYDGCLIPFLQHLIPAGHSILEIGCGTGYVLNALQPAQGMGIDIAPALIRYARQTYPHLTFETMDAHTMDLGGKTFDFILLTDTIGLLSDVQQVFSQLTAVCHQHTRIIITYRNQLWTPLLNLGEKLGQKMPEARQNWLDRSDIENLLTVTNLDVIQSGRKILMPRYIPGLSGLLNRYVANLPLLNHLGFFTFIIARSHKRDKPAQDHSVSVIIPARNEKGTIESLVRRIPDMGSHTELIFVEGHSTDSTWAEIEAVSQQYRQQRSIRYVRQDGRGKGDAVRKGFSLATGDILMILDADMTVLPEELPKFFAAITSGKGEFINGTRLVYPMEKQAMRTLNLVGNRAFSLAFTWLLNQRIKDTLCGTKVIGRVNYQRLSANRAYFGDFDPFGDFDLLFGAAKLNLKLVEIPIRYQARTYGETNISRFRHGWLLLKMTVFALTKIKFI